MSQHRTLTLVELVEGIPYTATCNVADVNEEVADVVYVASAGI
jgi:hypothetical protein